ncbi:MAG: type VI secretion system baseplate subunit TssK [Holosporaceae bacterium]|jgi:type VI secretion system protein ImpJ|nr:type VI secretion system baseplate subunit TssK [Holosporaceae bacterium]
MKYPIQWHEGMLLSPHHFQQLNNNIQHLFSVFRNGITFGVIDFKIDTSALASGVVRVLNLRGIFQDGLYFDFDAVNDQPLERDLRDYFTTNGGKAKLYVAIPARKNGENELTGDMARYYSAEIPNIKDENIGENAINIPILKPKLKLLLENEVDGRYTSFPMFEAEKSIDGGVVGTTFLPPFLALDEHSKIIEMCRDVMQIIRNKISYFSDRKDNFLKTAKDESLTTLRLLIQAALPTETIIQINGIHPFEIYKSLLEMAAKIISSVPTQLIPRLPVYEHTDLYKTFNGLLQYCRDILNSLKQQYEIVHFDKDKTTFSLTMKKEWMQKDEIAIGIQKAFASSDDDILAWINGVQIASESMLPMIKDKRVLGAERRILERGSYIVQPNGMTIISVKTKTAYIKTAEKLCLVNLSQNIVPEEVVLYAEY